MKGSEYALISMTAKTMLDAQRASLLGFRDRAVEHEIVRLANEIYGIERLLRELSINFSVADPHFDRNRFLVHCGVR